MWTNLGRVVAVGLGSKDVQQIAQDIANDGHSDFWFSDEEQKPHYHAGQTDGPTHTDMYHVLVDKETGRAHVDKRHSDDDPKSRDGADTKDTLWW